MKKSFLIILFLLFINSVSSQNEAIKSLVEKSNDLDMNELVTYAKKHLKEEEKLARFFYYWIGTNISYDRELLQKSKAGNLTNEEFRDSQKNYIVYENKKGVCAGFTNLFKWFMLKSNIETVIISGYIRNEENHYVELTKDYYFTHAWNAIKINGKWILVDTTWGTSEEASISEFYFDIKPEFAIITHYPKEEKWQLLEKPLSLEKFNNSKFIKPIWFFLGFSDIPKIKDDSNYYYFVYRTNTSNWAVDLKYSSDNINFKKIEDLIQINQNNYTYLRFTKAQMPKIIYFKVNLVRYSTTHNDIINFKIKS